MGITLGSICLDEEVPYPIWFALLCVAPACCRGTRAHAGCRSILFLFLRSLGIRADSLPILEEEVSARATLTQSCPVPPASQGQGGSLGDPCQMIPMLRAKSVSDAVVGTIIPASRRLRQETFKLKASLYHTASPYLEG